MGIIFDTKNILAARYTLTDKDVAHQGGRQAEHDHKDIGHGQIDDEKIGHRSHSWRPQHDRNDETVANQTDDKHKDVGHTVDGGQCQWVPIEQAKVGQTAGVRGWRVEHYAAVELAEWIGIEERREPRWSGIVLKADKRMIGTWNWIYDVFYEKTQFPIPMIIELAYTLNIFRNKIPFQSNKLSRISQSHLFFVNYNIFKIR